MAVTIHLELKGRPLRLLLDLVELAKVRTSCFVMIHRDADSNDAWKSHTGVNLAVAFRDVLEEFVAADVWPSKPNWGSWLFRKVTFAGFDSEVKCPKFQVKRGIN